MNYKEFGLKRRDMDELLRTISNYREVESALIFGSRAKGTFKKGSDIDLALRGSELHYKIIKEISVQLNEYVPIPFFVDVLDYTHLKKKELKKHIDVFGKLIYKRSKGENEGRSDYD